MSAHESGSYGLPPSTPYGQIIRLRGRRSLTAEDHEFNRQQHLARDTRLAGEVLSKSLDDQTFLLQSMLSLIRQPSNEASGVLERLHRRNSSYKHIERPANTEDELRSIAARQQEVDSIRPTLLLILNELQFTQKVLPGQPQFKNPEPDTPNYFIHAWSPSSHSFHDDLLGIRASDLLTLPENSTTSLTESSNLRANSLRNHCEGKKPSCFISLSDSPGRTRKWIRKTWQFRDMNRGVVAVIDTDKLLKMGVMFNRTTTLAQHLKIPLWRAAPRDGLHYANENFWVAYRWIPKECIAFYVSCHDFLNMWEKEQIGFEDQTTTLDLETIPKDIHQMSISEVT